MLLISFEKNGDISRMKGACHVIYIFFGSSLCNVLLCQVPLL